MDDGIEEVILNFGRELLKEKGIEDPGFGSIDLESECLLFGEYRIPICVLMEYLEIPNSFEIGKKSSPQF